MDAEYAKGVMFALRVLTVTHQPLVEGRGYAALTNKAMDALGVGSDAVKKAMEDADRFCEALPR